MEKCQKIYNHDWRKHNTDEIRNYFLEEIKQNELMSKNFFGFWVILNTYLF